jgi:ISXO2-like transposase domain/Transposase zinc-ribbon domain
MEIAMAKPVLSDARFFSEEAAFDYVETQLWPTGPVCPHCGAFGDKIGRLQGVHSKPSKKHPEGVVQIGLRKCYACRGPAFTVRKGTIFEDSHLPLRMWLQVIHLLCASKKGISTRQLQRMLNCGMKTAWHLGHRIRFAMADAPGGEFMGGPGKTVEADETYFGTIPKDEIMPRVPGKSARGRKAGIRRPAHRAVVALVERGGKARTFHVAQADQNTVSKIMRDNVAKETRIHTDESGIYNLVPWRFAQHETVKHSAKEYVRGDVTTNTVEGYFSVFKRGMVGVYQHCGEQHLHRYLSEFDFRYNNRIKLGVDDVQRAELAVKSASGKRLTYQTTHSA